MTNPVNTGDVGQPSHRDESRTYGVSDESAFTWWENEEACLAAIKQFVFSLLNGNPQNDKIVLTAAARALSKHPTGKLPGDGISFARDMWEGLWSINPLFPVQLGVAWVRTSSVQCLKDNDLLRLFILHVSLYARTEIFMHLVSLCDFERARFLWEWKMLGLQTVQRACELWLVTLVESGLFDEAESVSTHVTLPIKCLDIRYKVKVWEYHNPAAASAWKDIVLKMSSRESQPSSDDIQ